MGPEERLKELGIELGEPAKPVAAYVPTVRSGNLVFVSGQVPLEGGKPVHVGLLGEGVTLEEGQEAARRACVQVLAALKAELGDLSAVKRIVRVGVFVASTPTFTDHPKVANGASELLQEVFGEAGRHARAAVGVSSLPLGVCVEVDLVAEV
ncbi:MAG TPA: RidA family protein [Actinomycetota bacterium]|nr:RidA family protein [Actinomycetota bacterium]